MLRNLFARRDVEPSASLTYADVFEVMRYDRATDVLPYAIAYRPKPPHLDPSGPEPYFALLDSEAEFEAFWDALHGPLVFELSGRVSLGPLHRWNTMPSTLAADVFVVALYDPDDESRDWPVMQLSAVPPAMLAEGVYRHEDLARGRYNFRQFPASERRRYADEQAALQTAGPLVLVNGKVPFGHVEALLSRGGKG